jgi:hypothetical protein
MAMSNEKDSENKVAEQAGQAAHNVAHRETQGVRNEVSAEIRQRMGWLSRLKSMLGMR